MPLQIETNQALGALPSYERSDLLVGRAPIYGREGTGPEIGEVRRRVETALTVRVVAE
jgi:hypothetical protein